MYDTSRIQTNQVVIPPKSVYMRPTINQNKIKGEHGWQNQQIQHVAKEKSSEKSIRLSPSPAHFFTIEDFHPIKLSASSPHTSHKQVSHLPSGRPLAGRNSRGAGGNARHSMQVHASCNACHQVRLFPLCHPLRTTHLQACIMALSKQHCHCTGPSYKASIPSYTLHRNLCRAGAIRLASAQTHTD